MLDLSARIIIHSGEGEDGSLEEYTGKRTERAIKLRLTRERCHGDRWARAWIAAGPEYAPNTYYDFDGDGLKAIHDEDVD
jgi:hypothetical protein